MKPAEAEKIATLPPSDRRIAILKCMNLELSSDYDEMLRSDIHTNLLHDTFLLAVRKGFTWNDVCKATHLTEALLQTFINKNIVEATAIYQTQALESAMDNRSLAIYTEFFFSTFMQHFKLYQYVFGHTREEMRYNCKVEVQAPALPERLSNGKPPSIHEYEARLKEIQSRKQEVKEVLQTFEPEKVQLISSSLNSLAQTEEKEKQMTIKNIISEVVMRIGQQWQGDIFEAITSAYHDLDVKLDETALPRPKQLGQPPRYQLKPALPGLKTSQQSKLAPVSPQVERKKSGKNKV